MFRADYLQVDCQAEGFDRGFLRDAVVRCGSAGFAVGMYLDDDQEAKKSADVIVERQQELFDEVGKRAKALMEKDFWGEVVRRSNMVVGRAGYAGAYGVDGESRRRGGGPRPETHQWP